MFSPRLMLILVCGIWAILQSLFWTTPPFSDSLGLLFRQAWVLHQTHSIAALNDARFGNYHSPFIAMIVTAGWGVFGPNLLWPHLVSTFFGLIGIVGTYRLATNILNTRQAVVAATFVAFSSTYFAQATNLYFDLPAAVGLVWAVDALVRVRRWQLFCAVAFMSLSKETMLSLLVVLGPLALWRSRDRMLIVSLLIGVVPIAALVLAALTQSGALTGQAGSYLQDVVPHSIPEMVRRIMLGPAQLLAMGLWVPALVLLVQATRQAHRQRWQENFRESAAATIAIAATGTAAVTSIVHGMIAIDLNRYYLPPFILLSLVAWKLLPRNRTFEIAILTATLAWFSYTYFEPVRYRSREDRYSAVRAVMAHRGVADELAKVARGELVVASYPTTVELTYPVMGYVRKPVPVVSVDVATQAGGLDVKWAVYSDMQTNRARVRSTLSNYNAVPIMQRNYGEGNVILYRLEGRSFEPSVSRMLSKSSIHHETRRPRTLQ